MKLARLTTKRITVAVDMDGESLTVEYSPAVYTPNRLAEMDAAQDAEDPRRLARQLAEALTAWDLLWDPAAGLAEEGDEEKLVPYPLDAEALARLPLEVLVRVSMAITGEMRERFAPNPPASTA